MSATISRPFGRRVAPCESALQGPHAELAALSVIETAEQIQRREISCAEITQAYLERIAALDGREGLNAYVTIEPEAALAEAQRLDRLLHHDDYLGPLHGVPLAVKDAFDTQDLRTTGGTKILENWRPGRDAEVVRRLREAGALCIGKTNLHEASFGITSNNPHFGPVRNPYDHDRIPGGSSGGTGAAVSARLCNAGLGTDTGGSIRIPSALCGCVGIKPTLGRVNNLGTMGLSWTCDVSGPIARSVADAALLLQLMSARSDAPAGDVLADLPELVEDTAALKGMIVGLPGGLFTADNDPAVDACVTAVAGILEQHGAIIVEVDVADVELATPAGFTIVVPEAIYLTEKYWQGVDADLRIEEQLDHFGEDVRAVFGGERGTASKPVSARAYLEALRDLRPRVCRGFERALEDVDVLLTPTTPCPAIPIAEDVEMVLNGERRSTFETFIRHTFGVSLAGLPAISVPGGHSAEGLPIGVQFIARPWAEAKLIEATWAYEVAVSA